MLGLPALQQAPTWNAISEKYTGNPAVSFGDVLLSESQVRTGPDGGDMSPGAGGWPTVRYFNKETGYGETRPRPPGRCHAVGSRPIRARPPAPTRGAATRLLGACRHTLQQQKNRFGCSIFSPRSADGAPYAKKTSEAMCDELGKEDMMESFVTDFGGATLCAVADGAGCDDKENGFIEKWKGKSGGETGKHRSPVGAATAKSCRVLSGACRGRGEAGRPADQDAVGQDGEGSDEVVCSRSGWCTCPR